MTDIFTFPEEAEPLDCLWPVKLKDPAASPSRNKDEMDAFLQDRQPESFLARVLTKNPDLRDKLRQALEAEGAFRFDREPRK